jgi:peptidyl-prolyl cis-trans isomerase A (cyclophilin A)
MAQKKSSSRKRSRPVAEKKNKPNKNMMILAGLAVIIVIAVAAVLLLSGGNDQNEPNEIEGNPIAVIDTTKGIIKVELYQDKAPKTCQNFIKLVNDGFYDGMIFHRVMDDFMIQAGNTYPDGSTAQSPYGNIEFESSEDLSHTDGAISMASTGAGVGGSAQFFICDGAQPTLDGSYAVFGQTIEGFDVIRDIADEPHDGSYGSVGGGRPNTDIIINSITIE